MWRRVGEIEGGDHPQTRRFHLSMSCNHCLDPACLNGCPTNAYEKLDNGIVAHHADDCIGCQYCTWTCPYSVPALQPDRRIVTKCDMCLPRLDGGYLPACVDACPTHAITVEKVKVDEWRADHRAADAPELPSGDLTLSTTRIELPDVLLETYAASDWNLRPEEPHWPLVWLTLVSQVALGVSATAGGSPSGCWRPSSPAPGWSAPRPPRAADRRAEGAAQPAPLVAQPRGRPAVVVCGPGGRGGPRPRAGAGGRRRSSRGVRLGACTWSRVGRRGTHR